MNKLFASLAIVLWSVPGSSSFAKSSVSATYTRAERFADAILPQTAIEQGVAKFARQDFETGFARQPGNVQLEQQYPGILAACETAVVHLILDLAREDLPNVRKALAVQNDSVFSPSEMDQLIAFYAAIAPTIYKISVSPATKNAAQLDPPPAAVDQQVSEAAAAMTPEAQQMAHDLMKTSAGQKFVQSAPAREALVRSFVAKTIEKGRGKFGETVGLAAKTYIAQYKPPARP